MECIDFFKQYVKSPRITGAVIPSSQKLACKMIENIDFLNAKCIVEYGPGTGVFTDKVVEGKKDDTLFLVIEYNYEFYKNLKEKYENRKNIVIINDSAENIYKYLKEYEIKKVDYIISGLPFASLPDEMSNNILYITKKILNFKGNFITFQYTKFKVKLFEKYFKNIDFKKVLINFPPAYVLKCCNE